MNSARLSLLTFFGEAKKVSAPPGATPGQTPLARLQDCDEGCHVREHGIGMPTSNMAS
jgi:hypothetical protein